MEEIGLCPKCHQPVEPTAYFCPNCGKKLRSPPLSTSLSSLIVIFFKTILLPPFGLIWGIKYLLQSDKKSKIIGCLVLIITIVEIIWLIQSTINIMNLVNQQVSQQLNFQQF